MSQVIPAQRLGQGPDDPRAGSACGGCTVSPCCSNVPLATFRMRTAADLDLARYLLNFEGIELGMVASFRPGEEDWTVRLRSPCRKLDRSVPGRWLCSVHETPEQPRVCANFDGMMCWYRRVLGPEAYVVSGEFLRIDRARLELMMPLIQQEPSGDLRVLPEWTQLIELFRDAPLATAWFEAVDGQAPEPPPAAIAPPPGPQPLRVLRGEQGDRGGCSGCAAHCCETLFFPRKPPIRRAALDYTRFLLGFAGVRLGISDDEWTILVDTRCRHLGLDARCAVMGRSERPQLCRDLEAEGCSVRARLGPGATDLLQVDEAGFLDVADVIEFDDTGAVVRIPPVEQLSRHLAAVRARSA